MKSMNKKRRRKRRICGLERRETRELQKARVQRSQLPKTLLSDESHTIIRYDRILCKTDTATNYVIRSKEYWLSNSQVKRGVDNSGRFFCIQIPNCLASNKGLLNFAMAQ